MDSVLRKSIFFLLELGSFYIYILGTLVLVVMLCALCCYSCCLRRRKRERDEYGFHQLGSRIPKELGLFHDQDSSSEEDDLLNREKHNQFTSKIGKTKLNTPIFKR